MPAFEDAELRSPPCTEPPPTPPRRPHPGRPPRRLLDRDLGADAARPAGRRPLPRPMPASPPRTGHPHNRLLLPRAPTGTRRLRTQPFQHEAKPPQERPTVLADTLAAAWPGERSHESAATTPGRGERAGTDSAAYVSSRPAKARNPAPCPSVPMPEGTGDTTVAGSTPPGQRTRPRQWPEPSRQRHGCVLAGAGRSAVNHRPAVRAVSLVRARGAGRETPQFPPGGT